MGRPGVFVWEYDEAKSSAARVVTETDKGPKNDIAGAMLATPQVLQAPLRSDIVQYVHTHLAKNRRQANAPKMQAGYEFAAASWGTGRAVARIPRVPGGGTHRSGQGAYGPMCRGGHQKHTRKAWRRWNVWVNRKQRRFAVAAALTASAIPALVMARGHRIDAVKEVPIVVRDLETAVSKTKNAVKLLQALGLGEELDRVEASKKIRRGQGKMRNRRFTMRRGPLLVYSGEADGATLPKACRNIPGVDSAKVEHLNILQLAPGGKLGRLLVFSEKAFQKLDDVFKAKKDFPSLSRPAMMKNTDLASIINSGTVQRQLRPAEEPPKDFSKVAKMSKKLRLKRLMPAHQLESRRQQLGFFKKTKTLTGPQKKELAKARLAAEEKKKPAEAPEADEEEE